MVDEMDAPHQPNPGVGYTPERGAPGRQSHETDGVRFSVRRTARGGLMADPLDVSASSNEVLDTQDMPFLFVSEKTPNDRH